MNVYTGESVGPASYSTGGFTVSTGLSTVTFFSATVKTPGANLGQVRFDYVLDSPSAGSVKVKVMRTNYDLITAMGNSSGLPSGVTARSSSGGTTDAVSHTHSLDHDHPAVTSSGPTAGGATVNALTGNNVTTHTHSVDVANHTGTTGSEATHSHTFNNIYQHQHALTNTATDQAATELTAATDLSGTTFDYLALDA